MHFSFNQFHYISSSSQMLVQSVVITVVEALYFTLLLGKVASS